MASSLNRSGAHNRSGDDSDTYEALALSHDDNDHSDTYEALALSTFRQSKL